MANASEVRRKESQVRQLMAEQGLDALALTTTANFAWFTCGASNYVGIATETGSATVVITNDAKYLVCDNIEAPRIRQEELADQDYDFRTFKWYEGGRDEIIRQITGSGVLGSDIDMPGAKNVAAALDACRYSLTPEEIDRYRWLGKNTGECMAQTCRELEPGMTEREIAGILSDKLFGRGILPVVMLIAVDDRIENYRHPLPTGQKLERYAMVVTGARKWGLIVSTTRIVHFGEPAYELRCKHNAVTYVDAAFILNTAPGARVGDVFQSGIDAYAKTGYADEWQLHHQGGPTGYKGRDFRANAQSNALVQENQAYAWNPSITGTKSEDTIIATSNGPEVLSWVDDWPAITVEVNGKKIKRPDILIR